MAQGLASNDLAIKYREKLRRRGPVISEDEHRNVTYRKPYFLPKKGELSTI
jgi:hypothetical protein